MSVILESSNEYNSDQHNKTKCRQNGFKSWHGFDWRNKNSKFGDTCEMMQYLGEMISQYQYREFRYIKINELYQFSLKQLLLDVGQGGGVCLCVNWAQQILCFSRSCMQSEHRRVSLDNKATIFYKNIRYITVTLICSNKWLLIVDGAFLSLSCQHPGNFVTTNQNDHWKKFRLNCIIPYL